MFHKRAGLQAMQHKNRDAPTARSLFEPGKSLGGRYQVISCLGRGGMGVVYHVTQMFLNKEMALKTIERQSVTDEILQRFQREARTAFAVKHPNVITVDDFGLLDDQTPFLVMELIKGETLSETLKRKTTLPAREAIPLFIQICHGLDYAHKVGIIHRDIKPSNIMLIDDAQPGTEGSVKIVDFGIAIFAAEEDAEAPAQTSDIIGSPLYISPEQCSGAAIDHRTDIYSLGCVLFEALTGTPPFIGDNALTTMAKHKTAIIPTLREASLGNVFARELEEVVARMLAKSPEQRYQSAAEVAKDLTATMRGESIEAPKSVKPVKAKSVHELPKPLTISRSIFFAIVLLVILSSSSLAGFAAFKIKHQKLVPSPAPVVQNKFHDKVAESAMALDNETVDTLDSGTDKIFAEKLRIPNDDFSLSVHFRALTNQMFRRIAAEGNWVKRIDFELCTFDNRDLALLSTLPQLRVFGARSSNFDDIGAKALSKCKHITWINIGGTAITDKGVATLSSLKDLEYLELNGINSYTDASLKELSKLKHLRFLHLKGNKKITDGGLEPLHACEIFTLNLSDTNVTDRALKTLSTFPVLTELELSNTNVTANGLLPLLSKPSLKSLYIDGCKRITKQDQLLLQERAPRVKFRFVSLNQDTAP